MKARPQRRGRQRGLAIIALVALLVLGMSWMVISAVSAPANRTAPDRDHNARVLQQAKTALIGHVGLRAGDATTPEDNPGRLPCPEAPGSANNFGGGVYTESDDGVAAGNCTLPAVGRLPWRTLGLDKLTDSAGEPLWYVVSPAWALSNATLPPLTTFINSDTAGQLTLDAAGDVVALIIAPGPALNVQAVGGCTARNQTRLRQPNVDWDLRDFLECANADANAAFATNGAAGSFNDQVVSVTSGEVLPVIEASVASRFVKQFGTSMRYCGAPWPPCSGAGAAVIFPFAANFNDPGTSNFQGNNNRLQGLPPLSFGGTGPCLANTPVAPFCAPPPACAAGSDNRCRPGFVTYRNNPAITRTGGATLVASNCAVAGTPNTLTCTLTTYSSIFAPNSWMTFTMDVDTRNIGMSFRQINAAVQMTGVDTTIAGVNLPFGYSVTSAAMNNNGDATVRISSRVPQGSGGPLADAVCGLGGLLGFFNDCFQHVITLPFMWVDAPLVQPTDPTAAWFYRNGWHQLMYYAISSANAPDGGGACAGATCLTINGPTVTNTHRALLTVTGRVVPGQNRPSNNETNWLEGENVDLDSVFATRDPVLMINRTFNDHVVAIDSN